MAPPVWERPASTQPRPPGAGTRLSCSGASPGRPVARQPEASSRSERETGTHGTFAGPGCLAAIRREADARMARPHPCCRRDQHGFRLCRIELRIVDADREADHRGSLVGTALLRADERTAHAGVRRWLSGRPKESSDCAARSIRANPARKDWNRSSTRSMPSVRLARLLSHRNGMRDGWWLGTATTMAVFRAARWGGLHFSSSWPISRRAVVVVYKVDRLTRALGDFARIVELFDRHNVSFVSVTQSFNTTTSMGRLTLNVLLSFAQFE